MDAIAIAINVLQATQNYLLGLGPHTLAERHLLDRIDRAIVSLSIHDLKPVAEIPPFEPDLPLVVPTIHPTSSGEPPCRTS